MLIYTSKASGWGKQKPAQWGPLSAVRSAVFRNAERMGIDPTTIFVRPMWEGAGANSGTVNGRAVGTIGGSGAVWTGKGITFNSGWITVDRLTDPLSGASYSDGFTCLYALDNPGSATEALTGTFNNGILTGIQFYINTDDDTFTNVLGYPYLFYRGNSAAKRSATTWGSIGTNETGVFGFSIEETNTIRFIGNGQVYAASYIETQSVVQPVAYQYNRAIATRNVRGSLSASYANGISQETILLGKSSDDVKSLLSAAPYALLQPVPQPYYFDMAATTGLQPPTNLRFVNISPTETRLEWDAPA